MSIIIKICGINTIHSLQAALKGGADMIGLVFHPKSPRYIDLPVAADLADEARGRALVVALVCDADDKTLAQIETQVEPDIWQLHGKETPARVSEIRAKFKKPIIKAIGIATQADLDQVIKFVGIADHILLDAKPPAGAAYPGGHGAPFDWKLLAGLNKKQPFILSGGLTPETVCAAIKSIRAAGLNLTGVDVSSGVEGAKPGQKSLEKIAAFIAAVRKAG